MTTRKEIKYGGRNLIIVEIDPYSSQAIGDEYPSRGITLTRITEQKQVRISFQVSENGYQFNRCIRAYEERFIERRIKSTKELIYGLIEDILNLGIVEERYRSERNNILNEFFNPCVNPCGIYEVFREWLEGIRQLAYVNGDRKLHDVVDSYRSNMDDLPGIIYIIRENDKNLMELSYK